MSDQDRPGQDHPDQDLQPQSHLDAAPLDRTELLALLARLGAPEDAEVLAAARELGRRLQETGTRWEDLLAPSRPAGGHLPGGRIAGSFSDEDLEDPAFQPAGDIADDETLIARLLAEYDLSPQTREDLEDMRAAIPEGEFTERDSRYLRDLLARLTGRTPD